MTILWIAYVVFMVLFLFGITIFIHELGHFLVARRLGMRADVFSIGFGHAIWKKKVRINRVVTILLKCSRHVHAASPKRSRHSSLRPDIVYSRRMSDAWYSAPCRWKSRSR